MSKPSKEDILEAIKRHVNDLRDIRRKVDDMIFEADAWGMHISDLLKQTDEEYKKATRAEIKKDIAEKLKRTLGED